MGQLSYFLAKVDKVYGQESYTALVGAPGQAAVYVFEYSTILKEWKETQVRVLCGTALRDLIINTSSRDNVRLQCCATSAQS